MTCQGTTKSGKKCTARILSDGKYCSIHTPNQELKRKPRRVSRLPYSKGGINNATKIQEYMSNLFDGITQGKYDPSDRQLRQLKEVTSMFFAAYKANVDEYLSKEEEKKIV